MNFGIRYMPENDIAKFVGVLTCFSHLCYYCISDYFMPQMFDNLYWRLSYCLVSVPIILIDYWPNNYKRLSVLFWHLFLTYSITFAATYLTLQNQFCTTWLIADVIAIATLIALIDDLHILGLNLLIGVSLAIIFESVYSNNVFINAGKSVAFMLPAIVYYCVLARCVKMKGLAARRKILVLKSSAGSIAHEIRNPMLQIHNNLYFIEQLQNQKDISGSARSAVFGHIDHTRKVISSSLQFIDFSMAMMSERPVDPSSFSHISAKNVVDEAVNDYPFEEAAHTKLISVKGDDFYFMGDFVMFKYILYNLIKNAVWGVKTIPGANISISIMSSASDLSCIEVFDTGPGIPAKVVPQIFDSFFTYGKAGGTGLGLSYCKHIMTIIGGDISCRSVLGEYTVFTLWFPKLSSPNAMSVDKKNFR